MSEKHSIHCPARDIPVRAEVDVLVVGGGPAGIMAAEAAAGDGLRVMLVESRGFLGGNLTIGLPVLGFLGHKGTQIIKGLPQNFIDRLRARGAASEHRPCALHMSLTIIDPEEAKRTALEIMEEKGVEVLLYVFCTDVVKEGDDVKGVIIESKAGREAILAKTVIDCTGDGDVAFRAGVECRKGDAEGGMQPPTLMFCMKGVDVQRLRAEAHVLKAYYYFELAKRYGGVPLIDRVYADQKEANLPRGTFDEVVGLILREIEGVRNELVVDWRAENLEEKSGRITRGEALALKSRVLLYAASPQFNPSGEKSKWAAAAAAAFEVINMGIYSLHPDYGGLFVAETSTTSPETIWAVRMGATNEFERKNYPIGTQGGGTGICPSQNLVEAYESTGEDTGDAYAGLDPRFYATVLRNGDTWNGRTLEIYAGGADDPARQNASPTGYYLRKFLNENLNLTNDDKRLRSWIVFRYAEILLNFAEAMNEAYGPDDAHGYGMSARDAVDAVRARSGVGMPPVDVAPGDAAAMRTAIKHERRIELAFEDHRYWDLRRWDDAGTVLNRPLRGVKVTRSGDGFAYTPFEVAKRIFDAPKMNLYPIPQAEIVKSGGVLDQNPGW